MLLLLTSVSGQLLAQSESDSLLYDTDSEITVRKSSKADELAKDDAFNYQREFVKPPEGILDRISYWIQRFFMKVGEGGPVAWVFYGLLIIVLVIVLAQLLGFKYSALILRNKKLKSDTIEVFDEDIHSIDIDEIIQTAVRKKNYRKATRYAYLKLLKALDSNELIEWQADKTNHDYFREMRNSRFSPEFNKLTRTYEYVWYGEFDLNSEQFDYTYGVFKNLYKNLNEK